MFPKFCIKIWNAPYRNVDTYNQLKEQLDMNSKFWTIGLLSIATIATISFPVRAQDSDQAVIQNANQESVVTGNSNYTEQNANQTHVQNNRRGTGDSGHVQRSRQTTDVLGNGNDTTQNVEQTTIENNRRLRR